MPRDTNIVADIYKCGSRYASTKTAGELKYCNSLGICNKTIIPLALVVGYEIVIANSYPTRARGIIAKRARSKNSMLMNITATRLDKHRRVLRKIEGIKAKFRFIKVF